MTIEEYFGDWLKVIDIKLLKNVLNVLDKKSNYTPDKSLVFKAFRLCSLHDCKVILVGQEPYFQPNVATGVLFGNKTSTEDNKLSSSLQIIKNAAIDLERPKYSCIFDPTLESWAKQGCLMLNSALTVEINKPMSHIMIWYQFMIAFFNSLSKYEPGLIYVLFGNVAKNFSKFIDKRTNIILTERHPSYYARINKPMHSKIFYEINKLLKLKYNQTINWYEEIH